MLQHTPYTFKPHILALKGVFLYANACLLPHQGNLLLNQSKDVILKVVKKQFPEYDDEKISSRISFHWNQKESE